MTSNTPNTISKYKKYNKRKKQEKTKKNPEQFYENKKVTKNGSRSIEKII